MMFSRSVTRALARTPARSAGFHSTASASRIIASQPLRAKEAPTPLDAAKGYPVIEHEYVFSLSH